MTDLPDLSGARVYRETARPHFEDRWFVLPDGSVWFRNVAGELRRAIIAAATITSSATWTEVTDESTAADG